MNEGARSLRGLNVIRQKEEMTLRVTAAKKLIRVLRARRTHTPVEMIELLIVVILAIGLINGAAVAIAPLFPRH
jgi:hypothetical protein